MAMYEARRSGAFSLVFGLVNTVFQIGYKRKQYIQEIRGPFQIFGRV